MKKRYITPAEREKELSDSLWWKKNRYFNLLKKINKLQFIKSCTTSAKGIILNWVIFCAWTHPLFMHSGSNNLALSSVSLCENYLFLISRDLLSLSRDVVRLLGSWAPGSTGTCGWVHWSLHSDLRSFLGGTWCGKPKPVKIWMQMQDAIRQLLVPPWLTHLLGLMGHSGIPEADPMIIKALCICYHLVWSAILTQKCWNSCKGEK